MKKIIILTGLCFCFLINTCLAQDITYQHRASAGEITFAWTVDGGSLHVQLTAKTTGWVGIGFNPSEDMKDANFILGYVKKGKVKIRDDYGSGLRNHAKDTSVGGRDNFSNASGKEENGTTQIEFTIPLNSGDSKDRVINPAADTIVLLAYGAGRDSFISRHKYHAVLSVNLTTGKFKEVKHH
ncbi:MAG: DOMON domain-containing protein [Deltaproteobacteria bacterium]|nr:DOMON domain-containing protein [Deltaproteobacteria bacterium]